METLVEMKEDGSFKEKLEKLENIIQLLKNIKMKQEET